MAKSKWGPIGDWDVSGVTDFESAFASAPATFTGDGLEKWTTSSVTSLKFAFNEASAMNANLANWDTSKVTDLTLTFSGASSMNSDLSTWDVSSVTMMELTFTGASSFTGTGLHLWNVGKVYTRIMTMGSTMLLIKPMFDATALTSCNKRLIADAWKSSTAFYPFVKSSSNLIPDIADWLKIKKCTSPAKTPAKTGTSTHRRHT